MSQKIKILIIDDDLDMGMMLTRFLIKNGYDAQNASSGNKGIEKVKEEKFDIVLCDYRLGDKEGKDVLIQIKNHNPEIIVLIITGYSDIKTAVDVIKLGAYDYITKPLIPDEVLNVLKSAINEAGINNNNATKTAIPVTKKTHLVTESEFLVGETFTTKELYKQIQIVAPTDYSIILYGESGTGKEVMGENNPRIK
jgi:two-component system response regulator HydG